MSASAFLAIGANVNNPFENVTRAIAILQKMFPMDFKSSKLYETSPVSPIPQPNFINAVCSFTTHLTPSELFTRTQEVEHSLGKNPKKKIDPRPIDIDLLFYGNSAFQNNDLTLPHPRWMERLFVLTPLSDLIDSIQIDGATYRIEELIRHRTTHQKETITCIQ